jgi:cytochrome c oxidase subunit 1
VSISAFVIGISMLIFLVNVIWSLLFVRARAEVNPWNSKSVEWQLPSPVPAHDFERMPVFDADPYPYGEPVATPVAAAPAGGQT